MLYEETCVQMIKRHTAEAEAYFRWLKENALGNTGDLDSMTEEEKAILEAAREAW